MCGNHTRAIAALLVTVSTPDFSFADADGGDLHMTGGACVAMGAGAYGDGVGCVGVGCAPPTNFRLTE